MKKALIGHTGFVGGNIKRLTDFDYLFNSANIEDVTKADYDLVVCAAAPGEKWRANNNPRQDLASIRRLVKYLSMVKTEKLILVSTVDVYPIPVDVYEDSLIEEAGLLPYGKNRLFLEKFVEKTFNNRLIIRLPGLFGQGLKKNIIFDLINKNALDYTHKDSVYQFYDLKNFWKDAQTALSKNVRKINFATEPVDVAQLAKKCFGITFTNTTEKPPARYNMKTRYAGIFCRKGDYLYDRSVVLAGISDLVKLSTKQ